MAKLIIQHSSGSIDHDLTGETVTVGRAPDNSLAIDDVSVSSHHAHLIPSGDSYEIEDLGSTNGTHINGKTIAANEKHTLKPGDKIRFGRLDAVYDPENAADGETRELPQASGPSLDAAVNSVKPSNFQNASPFQKKAAEKDPVGKAALAIAALALVAALVNVVMTLQLG